MRSSPWRARASWAARMARHRPRGRRPGRAPVRRSASAMRWNCRSSGCAARWSARHRPAKPTRRGLPRRPWRWPRQLGAHGRARLRDRLRAGLSGDGTLMPAVPSAAHRRAAAIARLPRELRRPRGRTRRTICCSPAARPRRKSPATSSRPRKAGWCIAAPGSAWPIGSTPICRPGLPPILAATC